MYPSSGGGERSPAYAYGSGNDTRISDGTSSRRWLYVVAGFGILGAFFSGLSTSDFIAHLDRQVHSIHCSIVPGAAAQFGESGCRTVMMSPYSSLFRESLWGGLPISLLAMAVFFYMAARALSFGLKGELSRRETGYMLLATMLPFLMSIIYGYLSMRELGAVCKLCVGVYVSSGCLVIAALLAHLAAPTHQGASPLAAWAVWFLIGVGYVGVLAGLYVGLVPEPKASQEGCGTLLTREDPAEIILEISGRKGGVNALAVLDPLCPACKGFDARLEASGLTQELALEAVLFPLDASCNWMVKDSLHPGACAVSEAMLCLPKEAPTILESAFREQEQWLALAREDEAKLRRLLEQRFPKVKGCLGSAKAKNRVNKSLRFAVTNALPVLTPQLFIGDKRLCEEDTDLGLEYTVRRMINEVRP